MTLFDDDGQEIPEYAIDLPPLCITCRKNDDPKEEHLCQLTRLDQQEEPEFQCDAYVPA